MSVTEANALRHIFVLRCWCKDGLLEIVDLFGDLKTCIESLRKIRVQRIRYFVRLKELFRQRSRIAETILFDLISHPIHYFFFIHVTISDLFALSCEQKQSFNISRFTVYALTHRRNIPGTCEKLKNVLQMALSYQVDRRY